MARSTNVPENLLFITDRPYLTEALYESIVINYTRNKAFMRHFIKKLHCFIYPFHLTISTDQGVVLRNTGHSTLAHHHTKYFFFFFLLHPFALAKQIHSSVNCMQQHLAHNLRFSFSQATHLPQ